ncbi:O-antigen ligase family protein [Haliea sp. E17]|uniref:O-antigen ligase family protein n=1 Tax=Haliea sp. E17 TaxID=3401576 RepID=UPI003AADCA45
MGLAKLRQFLLGGGVVYLYAIFVAGFFLMPMAAGHRRVFYILVVPAVLLLWRELLAFYRHNLLAGLILVYAGYMLSSLAWTANFSGIGAFWVTWYGFCVLSFVLLSGYLWVSYPQQMQYLAGRAVWLAAAAALVSTVVWYLHNPFPDSRLEPLGVMHHPNKSGCAYGLFLVLAIHQLRRSDARREKLMYLAAALILAGLVVLTQSRTALLAVCVGLFALVGRRAIAPVIATVAASWLLVAVTPGLWNARVLLFSFRPGIWAQVLSEVPDHFWFGHGYLVDTVVPAYGKLFSHAHNSYLATLRDGGAVGVVLLLVLLAVALRWGWQMRTRSGEPIYLALLLYGALSLVLDYDRLLVHPTELWLFFWLPVALVMAVWPAYRERDRTRAGGVSRA